MIVNQGMNSCDTLRKSPLSSSLKMWVICGSVAGLRECQKWSESPKGHCRCCWPRQGWERRTMRQLFTATLRGLAFYEGGVGLVEDGVIEGGRATWWQRNRFRILMFRPMFSEGISDFPKKRPRGLRASHVGSWGHWCHHRVADGHRSYTSLSGSGRSLVEHVPWGGVVVLLGEFLKPKKRTNS